MALSHAPTVTTLVGKASFWRYSTDGELAQSYRLLSTITPPTLIPLCSNDNEIRVLKCDFNGDGTSAHIQELSHLKVYDVNASHVLVTERYVIGLAGEVDQRQRVLIIADYHQNQVARLDTGAYFSFVRMPSIALTDVRKFG